MSEMLAHFNIFTQKFSDLLDTDIGFWSMFLQYRTPKLVLVDYWCA